MRQFFSFLSLKGITRPQFADIKAYRDELAAHKPATVQAYIFTVRRFADGASRVISEREDKGRDNRQRAEKKIIPAQAKAVGRGRAYEKELCYCSSYDGGLIEQELTDLRTAGDNTVLYLQGKGREEKAEYVMPEQGNKARGAVADTELFTSKGRQKTTRSISGIAKNAMQAAGYDSDKLTAHSLRHTAVTLALIGNGGNIQEAQQFARHKNIATNADLRAQSRKAEQQVFTACSRRDILRKGAHNVYIGNHLIAHNGTLRMCKAGMSRAGRADKRSGL